MDIIWKEISNLSVKNDKVVRRSYSDVYNYLNNSEVKAYISGNQTSMSLSILRKRKGYEVDRSYLEVKMWNNSLYRRLEISTIMSLRPCLKIEDIWRFIEILRIPEA